MSDESILRQQARAAIQAGKLPGRHADRTWAGEGSGGCCSVCAEALQTGEVEFELEFVSGNEQRDAVGKYRLHVRCFAAWKFELQRRPSHDCEISDRSASK